MPGGAIPGWGAPAGDRRERSNTLPRLTGGLQSPFHVAELPRSAVKDLAQSLQPQRDLRFDGAVGRIRQERDPGPRYCSRLARAVVASGCGSGASAGSVTPVEVDVHRLEALGALGLGGAGIGALVAGGEVNVVRERGQRRPG